MKPITQSNDIPGLPVSTAQVAPIGATRQGPFDLVFSMIAVGSETAFVSEADRQFIGDKTVPENATAGDETDLSLLVPGVDLTGLIPLTVQSDLSATFPKSLVAGSNVLVSQISERVNSPIGDMLFALDQGQMVGQLAAAIPKWVLDQSGKGPAGALSEGTKIALETNVAQINTAPAPQTLEGDANQVVAVLPTALNLDDAAKSESAAPEVLLASAEFSTKWAKGQGQQVPNTPMPTDFDTLQINPDATDVDLRQAENLAVIGMKATPQSEFDGLAAEEAESTQINDAPPLESKPPVQFVEQVNAPAGVIVDPKSQNDSPEQSKSAPATGVPQSPDRIVQQSQNLDSVTSVKDLQSDVPGFVENKSEEHTARNLNVRPAAAELAPPQDGSTPQDLMARESIIHAPARRISPEGAPALSETRGAALAQGPVVPVEPTKTTLEPQDVLTLRTVAGEPVPTLQPSEPQSGIAATGGMVLADTPASQRLPTPPLPPASLPEAAMNMRQADWGRQLVDRIERISRDGSESVELSLRPKTLGALRINLEIQGDRTSVHFVTETGSAARMLLGNEDKLSQLLDQSGFRLGGFSAQGGGAGSGQNGQPQARKERITIQNGKRVGAMSPPDTPQSTPAGNGPSLGSSVNMLA